MEAASDSATGAQEIERFLGALALDGFCIGVRDALSVHLLLRILSEQNVSLKSSDSRAMFTALIARDQAEQQRVAELYDRSIREAKTTTDAPQKTRSGPVAMPQDANVFGRLLAGIAALAFVVMFSLSLPKPADAPPTTPNRKTSDTGHDVPVTTAPATTAPSERTTNALYVDLNRLMRENKAPAAPTLRELQKAGWPPKEVTGGVQLSLPALVQRLQMPPDWPIKLDAEDVRRKIMSAFADFGIAAQMPSVVLESGDTGLLSAVASDIASSRSLSGTRAEDYVGLSLEQRVAKVRNLALNNGMSARENVSDDLIDRALAVESRELRFEGRAFADASWRPRPAVVAVAPGWLRPVATAAPFMFAAVWFLGLAGRRRGRIIRQSGSHSPLEHSLVVEAPDDIRVNRTDKAYLTRVAGSLNVRQTKAALAFDSDRTVTASIAAGGLFTPVRGRVTSTPAYLLFIEAKGAGDQEARRLEMLHRRLADAGVNTKRFFYFDSPAWLHEEFGDDPRPIEEIAARYEDRRLIVLGEGRGFLTPLTNTPQPWVRVLAVWPQRAMLTPRPLQEWAAQEFAIAGALDLPLGRATIEGLFALAELLGLDDGRDRPLFRAYAFTGGFDLKPLPALVRSRPYYWLSENDPGEGDAKRLDNVLRYYLDAEGLLWLKALAVYPALEWGLTLYLGRELGFFEEPRLAALTLLPWLRESHMPLWLRQRFIAALPDDIRVATIAAIHRLMKAEGTPRAAQLALLRHNPMRRPSLRGREPARDRLFLKTLANEGNFPAPSWMRPSLKSWFATLTFRELGVAVTACVYSAAAYWLTPSPADGALGPGAFMPLFMLVVIPGIGWLGLALFDRGLRSYRIAGWRRVVRPRPTESELARLRARKENPLAGTAGVAEASDEAGADAVQRNPREKSARRSSPESTL